MSTDTPGCDTCFAYKQEVYRLIFADEFGRAVELVQLRTAHRRTHLGIMPTGVVRMPLEWAPQPSS